MDTPERRVWDERRPKDMTLQIILVFTLALCKCKTKYIHCNRISVSVKNLDVLSVNNVHLHAQQWFVGLAYQGKNIAYRFVIEYSSLRDFGHRQ